MNTIKMLFFLTAAILMFLFTSTFLLKEDWNKGESYSSVKNTIDTVKVSGNDKVKVYIADKKEVIELNVEEYIKGVVSAEMPANFNIEAIKAQAVAARTFYFAKRNNPCKNAYEGEICNTTHCQVYMSKEERMEKWDASKRAEYYNKITEAVESTCNKVLTYDAQIIKYPQFFATSSGKTESAMDVFLEDVPYLKSKESKGEEVAPKFESIKEININEFINKIKNKYPNADIKDENLEASIKIESLTEGGAVGKLRIGNISISGIDFRSIFELNSANFNISILDETLRITCKGYGHGLGMSQWGANAMAEEGKSYEEILKYYYSGIEIKKVSYNGIK